MVMLAHRVSCGQDCRLVSLNLIALGCGRPPYRLANVSRSPGPCCRGTTDIDPTLSYWTVQNSWGPVSARPMSKIHLDRSADICFEIRTQIHVVRWPTQTWGENGYFKMVWDFTDEFNVTHSSCGVGKGVVAGLPDLSKSTSSQGIGRTVD